MIYDLEKRDPDGMSTGEDEIHRIINVPCINGDGYDNYFMNDYVFHKKILFT